MPRIRDAWRLVKERSANINSMGEEKKNTQAETDDTGLNQHEESGRIKRENKFKKRRGCNNSCIICSCHFKINYSIIVLTERLEPDISSVTVGLVSQS